MRAPHDYEQRVAEDHHRTRSQGIVDTPPGERTVEDLAWFIFRQENMARERYGEDVFLVIDPRDMATIYTHASRDGSMLGRRRDGQRTLLGLPWAEVATGEAPYLALRLPTY